MLYAEARTVNSKIVNTFGNYLRLKRPQMRPDAYNVGDLFIFGQGLPQFEGGWKERNDHKGNGIAQMTDPRRLSDCDTGFILLDCAYESAGFSKTVDFYLTVNTISIVVSICAFLSTFKLRRFQISDLSEDFSSAVPSSVKRSSQSIDDKNTLFHRLRVIARHLNLRLLPWEIAVLFFTVANCLSGMAFMYLSMKGTTAAVFQAFVGLRSVIGEYGALIYVDSILAMDVAIADSLTILRWAMLKPIFLCVFVAETLNFLVFYYADKYKEVYTAESVSTINSTTTTELPLLKRSSEADSIASLVNVLQICMFAMSIVTLALLTLAVLIARYKFIKVLRERLEKRKGGIGRQRSRNGVEKGHQKDQLAEGLNDSGNSISSAHSRPTHERESSEQDNSDAEHCRKKKKGKNVAKERMIKSVQSAVFVLGLIAGGVGWNLTALIVLSMMTQIFPSPSLLYFVTMAGDWG
ncbi:hypothetical protein HDU97_010254 [Phlyctochytrium planicorne]|nr:hypothetical protein HDU97_010254 [Phlyctochytrium planicorne]